MRLLKDRLWAAIACGLMLAQPAYAETPAKALVNRQVWKVTLETGPSIRMVFLADGTVEVRRFLAPDLQWFGTDDGLCIEGGPGSRRWARLVPTDDGFVGKDGITHILTLNR